MSRTLGNVLVALLLVLSGAGPRAWSAEPPQPRIPIICPAVWVEDRPPDYDPDDFQPHPELIVLGKARSIGDDWEVPVEKVLYGSWPGGKVQFRLRRLIKGDLPVKDQRGIFALAPELARSGPEDKPFQLLRSFDVSEEKAVRAMAAARLDYNTLAAECLFVGKEVEVRNSSDRTVEILKPLGETHLRKGERICVHHRSVFGVEGKKPALHKDPEIYFIRCIDREPKESVYHAACRLPADWEAAVLAALKRRDEYPIIPPSPGGEQPRSRMVLFRGSHTEAVELLGSRRKAFLELGGGKLLHEYRTSKPTVIAAIEKGLVRTVEKKPGEHWQLYNLIQVLGEIQRREGNDADLRRLIEGQIEHLASNPPEPPTPPKQSDPTHYETFYEGSTDANHGLLWLLRQLDGNKVHKDFGPRLQRLREQVKGYWKQEVQRTLDVCDIEEQQALEKALWRFQGVKPAVTARQLLPTQGHRGRIEKVFFSPDGKTLRSLDNQNFICNWDAATLRFLGRVSFPASLRVLSARAPDGKYLLCLDRAADAGRDSLKTVDADTGGVLSSFTLERSRPPWETRDNTVVLWLNASEVVLYRGGKLARIDFRQGKVSKEIKADRALCVWLNGSEVLLYDRGGRAQGGDGIWWAIDLLTGKGRSPENRGTPRVTDKLFGEVPGHRYFFATNPDLYLLDRKTLDVAVVKHFRDVDLLDLTFSGDGSRYAVVTGAWRDVDYRPQQWDQGTQPLVRVYETSSGKAVVAFPASTRSARCRLSPDGKRLVVTNDDTLESWDLTAAGNK